MSNVSLHVGLKALLTAQSALDTVGHNVSNANTPGYSRQNLLISASPALILRGLAVGNGVDANLVLRTADDLLTRRLVAQTASIQQLEARLDGMSQVEALLGEPGERGLNALMQNFFSSVSALAASPEDVVLRTGLVQSTQSLTSRVQELAASLGTARTDGARQVELQVDSVNTLTDQIAKLNREIGAFEGSGVPANDLRDQRDLALSELGKLVNISYNENSSGSVTVLTNGAVIVGASRAYEMQAQVRSDGALAVRVEGNPNPVTIRGGAIGGLIQQSQVFVPALRARVDELAHNMILEFNRAHSTGMPPAGGFHSVRGEHSIADVDQDGELRDELLSNAGLPFEVQDGALYVNVQDEATGAFSTRRIDIERAGTTVGQLLDALSAVPHVAASLDSSGRIQITADDGYAFDFSRRVNPQPDVGATFGGGAASLGSGNEGPFNLAHGDTLTLNGPSGPYTVTLDAADFADIDQATPRELAAVLNADPAFGAAGMRAVESGGRLHLQSLASGASAAFTLTGGTALAALGWSPATTVTGQAHSVDVEVTGTYSGANNEQYRFAALSDGTIGTTPGLTVGVFDAQGTQVATLSVGDGYSPGRKLDLPNGLQVSFGLGDISATDRDQFVLEALSDSDTSDALVALGVNSFLSGTDASDIALRAELARDPALIASSMTGAEGDNTTLNDMLGVQHLETDGLGEKSLGQYYGDLVGGLGFDIDVASSARDVDQFLFDSLTERRQAVAGVNVDEELVNMLQFQQSYGAAAQFIQVVNRLHDDILNLL